ncbi:MAG: hypothetical protein ACLQVN_16445 [Bryobacteraceae bacterium]
MPSAARAAKARQPSQPDRAAAPRWFQPALLGLALLLALGVFSRQLSDSDFWWHLKTGEWIVRTRRLPVPDPFAYTTALARPAYAGEQLVRYFNLTHEWLAQALIYLWWRATGFGGVVLLRALLLTLFCGAAGWIVWRRRGNFYWAMAAGLGAASASVEFANDRPYLATFLFLAAAIAVLESRRRLWLLAPLFLLWANCHGGFFLGWMVVGVYAAEALWLRARGRAQAGDGALYAWGAAAVLVSGLNPNGFRVLEILLLYRSSDMQSRLLEWTRPELWPPSVFSALLVAGAAVLVWRRARVRVADWLLFAAFALAALTALRNTILIGWFAPIAIASYLPWELRLRPIAQYAAAAIGVAALAGGVAEGRMFQLRVAEWKYPAGAADFLLSHGVRSRLFNTYEDGGYLIWRLAPREKVFIDGRALSERLYADYIRILYNHDATGGKDAFALLDRYGVQTIVINGFEFVTGQTYLLAPGLADPAQTGWKLVYEDPAAMVFMRHPPPDVAVLDSLRVFPSLEAECEVNLEHEPGYPRCARALGQMFSKLQDWPRARRWIGIYLEHAHGPDPQAEEAYRRLLTPR